MKETRKFGLHLIVATQTLEEITDRQLKHILLSNTAVKIVGTNGMHTQKTLAQQTGIPFNRLEHLGKFQFVVKAGEGKPMIAKTSGILTRAKSLYMKPHETRSFNKRMVEETGYYKPEIPTHPGDDRITDFPEDMQAQLWQEHSPTAKYSL